MPAHKLSAATKASRDNLKKAREVLKQKKLEAESANLKEQIAEQGKAIEVIPALIEAKTKDAAIDILAKQAKRSLGTVLKAGALAAWEEAGGGDRLRKLLKKDDKFFKEFTIKAMVPLAKSDPDDTGSGGGGVQVNIYGLGDTSNTQVNVVIPKERQYEG